jgi:tripartite-type tricarboxylate transporter receptor subunit TctC
MRVNAVWTRLCAFGAGLFSATLAIGLMLGAASRAADTYPDHKVRVIVPFAAGGPTDVIARMVADRLSDAWGQQLYVENMPGAGGNLGVETGARATPDGYTIVVVSTGFIINPSMYSKIGYDPVKDFAPISLVAASPNVVTVHPSLPAKDLKELIDLIKANPGKYSYAQPATGSTPHLAGELFKQTYNLDLVTVPFNGAPLAINSTMGNHTPIAFTALPPAIGNIKDGTLRGAAVLAKTRVAALPDLPTNVEEGVSGLESDTLTGIVAPAGTPPAIIEKWHAAIVKMAADPETKKKLDALGFVPVANSPAEFADRIKSEMARWDKVVKTAGIHVD